MSRYRIICTNQTPSSSSPTHAHIVSVGTGTTATKYDQTWTVSQVYMAMDRGDEFYTFGESSRQVARVEKFNCCGRDTLRSTADATTANNLGSLPRCG